VPAPDHANRKKARLIHDIGRRLDQIRIIPERLGLIEVDPVLCTVRGTLVGIILKLQDNKYMPKKYNYYTF